MRGDPISRVSFAFGCRSPRKCQRRNDPSSSSCFVLGTRTLGMGPLYAWGGFRPLTCAVRTVESWKTTIFRLHPSYVPEFGTNARSLGSCRIDPGHTFSFFLLSSRNGFEFSFPFRVIFFKLLETMICSEAIDDTRPSAISQCGLRLVGVPSPPEGHLFL